MPDWLVLSLLTAGVIAVPFAKAWRNARQRVARTRGRRANPTGAEFVAMLARDVRPETAEFVWFAMIEYLEPWRLTPHPDDHLVKDLPLGKNDPASDWLPRFARFHGANSKAWPQWPENWERTVRNFARWLELGLSQQS